MRVVVREQSLASEGQNAIKARSPFIQLRKRFFISLVVNRVGVSQPPDLYTQNPRPNGQAATRQRVLRQLGQLFIGRPPDFIVYVTRQFAAERGAIRRLRRCAVVLRLRQPRQPDFRLREVVRVEGSELLLLNNQVDQDHRTVSDAPGAFDHPIWRLWFGDPGQRRDRNCGPDVIGFQLANFAAAFDLDSRRSAKAQPANTGPQPYFGAGGARRIGYRAADLSEAVTRIEKSSRARRFESRNAVERLASHLRKRSCRHAPSGLNRRKLLRRSAPDFHRVRKIKITADGLPQTTLQHARKGLRPAVTGVAHEFAQRVP